MDSCISFTPSFPSLIQTGAGSDYVSQWTEVTDGRCDQKWVFLAVLVQKPKPLGDKNVNRQGSGDTRTDDSSKRCPVTVIKSFLSFLETQGVGWGKHSSALWEVMVLPRGTSSGVNPAPGVDRAVCDWGTIDSCSESQ